MQNQTNKKEKETYLESGGVLYRNRKNNRSRVNILCMTVSKGILQMTIFLLFYEQ